MAMARFMATTGVGVIDIRWSYRARIWLQSVAVECGGVGVDGIDGCLDLVRPGLIAAKAGPHDRLALLDEGLVPRRPVLIP